MKRVEHDAVDGTYDKHRQRVLRHEFFQKFDAVHPRHFYIEGHNIGVELENFIARLIGVVRGADHLDGGILGDFVGDEGARKQRIVHDENAYFF